MINHEPNTYLGVNLQRWKDDMVDHLASERRYSERLQERLDASSECIDRMERRNKLLQQALDDSNALVAKMQAELIAEQEAPAAKRVAAPRPPSPALPEDLNLERIKVRYIRAALDREETLTLAAVALGVDRATLYAYVEKYGMKRKVTGRMRPRLEMAG